ncbi:hypothetical protein [Cupriavidus gilardii]|uniref:hypothetical protein n=1 Tax=Cupriavidus gilardii TaxID=82541 RepID=UPI0007E2F871|nr:hypothetical protein [Cupriavidus gilardii]
MKGIIGFAAPGAAEWRHPWYEADAAGAGTARHASVRTKAGTVEIEAAAAIFDIANPGGQTG